MSKTLYLGLEDLVGNAFIEMLKAGIKKELFVTYERLEAFRDVVMRLCHEKANINLSFTLSRNDTADMLYRYSQFFSEEKHDTQLGIALREGIDQNKLIQIFRGYLPWPIIYAFSDKNATSVLIEANVE